MNHKSIRTIATTSPEPGTGILHPFPTRGLPHLDPFVFLDTGTPQRLGSREIYVGPHPHRGVQPVSLLFRGRIRHRDSLGNEREVHSGGMQWLVAGKGALHDEFLGGDEDGVFHMAQLWINVPAADKARQPEHHALPASDIPTLQLEGQGASARLYAGSLGGAQGPAPVGTSLLLAHVELAPGGTATIPVPRDWTTAFTVVDGEAQTVTGGTLEGGATAVFANDGEAIAVESAKGGQLLLMCGNPIEEPIAMGGGFVMNTREEIAAAYADYQRGAMGTLLASR